ncbi:MAG TPA: thioredoxin fold domain-containing protein [Desulfuromonadales bacterium]|nr:thioredoxin fold domain-containing protein [Desulfuromonadales bacterium]
MIFFVRLLSLSVLLLSALSSAAADLDFSKSITIGKGEKVVVEFTDPDCPFCRKASAYFDGRKDVTRHVFFYPLPNHPNAKEKVQYILSQTDRGKAYHDVMTGRLDAAAKLEGILARGIKLQEEQMEIVKKMKIKSTPTFMLNGRIIEGFDVKRIEEALGPVR